MLATLPPEPIISSEQVHSSSAPGKSRQIPFYAAGIFSIRIDVMYADEGSRTVVLRPRTPTEAGARLLRMARPIHWPTDGSDTEY